MPSALERFAGFVDALNALIGRAAAWLTLAMVVLYFMVALLRYAFASGWIWMQESVVWMHALVFMLAAAVTLQKDQHVRVDIFYGKRSARGKAWTDLAGSLVFLLPLSVFLFWAGWDYVVSAWLYSERSSDAGGLSAVYLLKTLILVLAVQLGLQALAQAARAALVLRKP